MRIKPYTAVLRDGTVLSLRGAVSRDGALVNAFRRQTAGETDFLLRYPDEVPLSPDGQTKRLADGEDDPGDVFLLALDGSALVGFVHLYAFSGFEKTKHRACVGVQVARAYRSRGIGRLLMTQAVRYAREAGYEIIQLSVAAQNTHARALYDSLGFTEFSHLPHAFRLRDGTEDDEVGMVLRVKE